MTWMETPWWKRQNQHPWWFWVDPYGEVRVTDPKHRSRYIYTRPAPAHQKLLQEAGWVFSQGNPDCWWTDNAFLAKATLDALGLTLPVWETNHCCRVYWHEWSWSI